MSKSLQNVVTKTIAEISLHWKVFQGQLGHIMFKHDTNVQCNCDCLHMPTVVINACFKCITHIELHKDTSTRMLQSFPFNMCAPCFLSDQMKSCVWGRNVLLILTSWNLNFQIFFCAQEWNQPILSRQQLILKFQKFLTVRKSKAAHDSQVVVSTISQELD